MHIASPQEKGYKIFCPRIMAKMSVSSIGDVMGLNNL
jgi:hypothetical protein